jgi:hypothetical protein
MQSSFEALWTQLRRVWRPALLSCVVMTALGACVQWDPATETIVPPGRESAAAPQGTVASRGTAAPQRTGAPPSAAGLTDAARTPPRTEPPRSSRRARTLAARSD